MLFPGIRKKGLFFLFSAFIFIPLPAFGEMNFQSTTTEDVITLNAPQRTNAPKPIQRHAFFVGGFANLVYVDSDILDDVAGGGVSSRYTYMESVSFELNTEFNQFDFDKRGFNGDIFSVPTLFNFLLHSPWWNNVRFYVLGGVGYQFNDADASVDVVESGLDGSVAFPVNAAAVEAANNALIDANAKVTALSSSSSSSSTSSTTTSSSSTVGSTIRREAALAAAQADANIAAANLAAARQVQVRDLKSVVLPSNTPRVDIEVDDAFIATLGAGVDIRITPDLLFNIEGRYQYAEYDIEGSVFVPGFGTISIDDKEDFDALFLKAGFLLRL